MTSHEGEREWMSWSKIWICYFYACIRAQPDETKDFLIFSLQATKTMFGAGVKSASGWCSVWAASWWVRKSSHLQFLNRLLPLQIVSISLLQLLYFFGSSYRFLLPSIHPVAWTIETMRNCISLERMIAREKAKEKEKNLPNSWPLPLLTSFTSFSCLVAEIAAEVEGRANEEKGRWFSLFALTEMKFSHSFVCLAFHANFSFSLLCVFTLPIFSFIFAAVHFFSTLANCEKLLKHPQLPSFFIWRLWKVFFISIRMFASWFFSVWNFSCVLCSG